MGLANYVMSRFPSVEVGMRCIYNRIRSNDIIKKSNFIKRVKSYVTNKSSNYAESGSWEKYCNYIRELSIRNGDILIVHSSMDGLSKLKIEKEEIVSFLRDIVGPEGTLVMPAYPFYKKQDIKLQFDEEIEEVRTYKPKTTLSWTGLLPNYLCSLNGTERSLFPIDTLAAIGKEANEIVKDNLNGQISHGKNTAWDYCNRHHAKVLFIGVSPLDCISEIHIYEDMNEDKWPIREWYKEQSFVIKTGSKKINFTCKTRKKFWNQYITENYCMEKLIKGGVMDYAVIEKTPIGFIKDLYEMTNFVADSVNNKKDLLFWKIPKKYWKKQK